MEQKNETLLEIHDLSVSFRMYDSGLEQADLQVISDLHLTVRPGEIVAVAGSSGAKFLTLHLVVVRFLCNILPLKQPQITTFSTMFTWPQLITALIGGTLALLIAPVIRKSLHR